MQHLHLDDSVTTSISLPSARAMPPWHAVLTSAAIVVLWAVWAAVFNTAQFGDNIEQFNWAQSLELGYHKHPPLPSVALGLVIKLFGPSVYWAYTLATLCLLGTLWLTWLIGRELLGDRLAAAAVVLWGLNLSFSQRVQLYNHNTVLVLCIAATVWCALRATRSGSRGQWAWWGATGVAAGAAMLSKYQALVPLAGLLLALVLTGRMKRPAHWLGFALAVVVMLVVFTPHAIWVARNDFTTLRYASDAVESATLWMRLRFVVAFLANQVRLAFPALLTIAICWTWMRRVRRDAVVASDAAVAPDFGRWMIGLTWVLLAVLFAMALVGGVSLRNHWGVQVLQFFPLWMVMAWDRRIAIDLKALVVVAVAVQALSLTYYAVEHRDPNAVLSNRRIDTAYPARRLARTAVAHWASATNCPLHYVEGSVFDAGLVSLYSGGHVQVFDSDHATPWVRAEDLQRDGALFVLDQGDPVPPGVTNLLAFDLVPTNRLGLTGKTLTLGVRLPAHRCS
jgi:4-amino-4-deoxy-L-arabinose transferase-like glycosyltransferase